MTLSPTPDAVAIAATVRPSISKARRARIFEAAKGVCWLCSGKIMTGEPWEVEHRQARGLFGSDGDENLSPAHVDCHKSKTRADRQIMAKADAQRKACVPFVKRPEKKKIPSRPFGASRPMQSRPFPARRAT